jgi:anti-sigma-K factor RskA
MTQTEHAHERWSEDLAAYVLGALEPERAAELERHADGCESCRSQIDWLAPAVRALPDGVKRVEPPPRLRERVMAAVRADAVAHEARRSSFFERLLGAASRPLQPLAGLAAVLLVAAIAGYAIAGSGSDGGGGGATTVVAGQAPGVVAKMVREGERSTLHLANVEQLPDGRVLEAWVQRRGEVEPVRALFVPDREGRASTQLPEMDGVEVVMVTAEPKGGSDSPTSSPIATLAVPQ